MCGRTQNMMTTEFCGMDARDPLVLATIVSAETETYDLVLDAWAERSYLVPASRRAVLRSTSKPAYPGRLVAFYIWQNTP
jgi:hypothetical protein